MAFDPHKFKSHRNRYPSYKYVDKHDRQPLPTRCSTDCICDEASTTCPCVVNRNTCDDSCKCQSCSRRFPPCNDSGCDKNACGCRLMDRQCEKGRCGCTNCHNSENSHGLPLVDVKDSEIQGQGLFACHDIKKDMRVGEYNGEPVEIDSHEQDSRVTLFRYSKYHCIKPDENCNLAYVNHQPHAKANACFRTVETSKGRQIRLYTKKVVRSGDEITADYNLELDEDSKIILYHGYILEPGKTVVRVYNGTPVNWFAFIEDSKKVKRKGRTEVSLDVLWLERDSKTQCGLISANWRNTIEVDAVDAVVKIATHSDKCNGEDICCWSKSSVEEFERPLKNSRQPETKVSKIRPRGRKPKKVWGKLRHNLATVMDASEATALAPGHSRGILTASNCVTTQREVDGLGDCIANVHKDVMGKENGAGVYHTGK